MHGKLLMVAGLAISGATVAAALHPDLRFLWHRIPTRRAVTEATKPPAPPRPRVQRPGSHDDGRIKQLQARDGRVITLPLTRGFSDSADAARARDSIAALLAPGQQQLACDLETQPRFVRTLSLLVADDVLIEFQLRRARSGPLWALQPSGYLLQMEAKPLSTRRVRELCNPPLGALR